MAFKRFRPWLTIINHLTFWPFVGTHTHNCNNCHKITPLLCVMHFDILSSISILFFTDFSIFSWVENPLHSHVSMGEAEWSRATNNTGVFPSSTYWYIWSSSNQLPVDMPKPWLHSCLLGLPGSCIGSENCSKFLTLTLSYLDPFPTAPAKQTF